MQTIQSQHYDGAPQEKSKAKSKKQKNRPFLVKCNNDRIIRFVLRLVFSDTQTMQSILSFNPCNARHLFSNNDSKERPKGCDAFSVTI